MLACLFQHIRNWLIKGRVVASLIYAWPSSSSDYASPVDGAYPVILSDTYQSINVMVSGAIPFLATLDDGLLASVRQFQHEVER